MKTFIELKNELILASNSPRRRSLLEEIGIYPRVIPSNVDETVSETEPEKIVMELSKRKALYVAREYPDSIVIGADTIVVCEDRILGKPKDPEDAFNMLMFLSGKYNYVYTGVSVVRGERIETFYEKTAVKMFDNDPELIRRYVKTGIPLDKSGSYGIQGYGSVIIESISGDYYSVMGLPVGKVVRCLIEMGRTNL